MAKPEQALTLDPPSELQFIGPFTSLTTIYLKLTNPTNRPIAFKVKTTAPKTYCVRPNGGFIAPNQVVSVHIIIQTFDPDNDDRSKDKFMVQSMYIPDGQEYSDSLWHDVPPEGLMNSKLRCVFFPTPEAAKMSLPPWTHYATYPLRTPGLLAADIADVPDTKSKPTVIPESKVSDTDRESSKLIDEFKKLKAELGELRQENSALKEEGIRSRLAYGLRTKVTNAKVFESDSQPPVPKKQFSNYLIIISVFIFLLGIYIGKNVL